MTSTIIPNGFFTITSPTGEHRTFQVKTVLKGSLEGKRTLGLLEGPNNTSDYRPFAFVNDNGITVWRKNRGQPDTETGEVKASFHEKAARLIWNLLTVENSGFEKQGFRVEISKRCLVCNRVLSTPESLEIGIGPECLKKSG
jgi:hypothetical protein